MRERIEIKEPKKKVKAKAEAVPTDDNEEGGERFDTIFVVNARWRIVWEGLQYIVQSKHTRESGARAGTSYWRNVAYIVHFGDALLWLARRRIYAIPGTYDGVEALQVLNDRIDEIQNEIRSTMKEFLRKRYDPKTQTFVETQS